MKDYVDIWCHKMNAFTPRWLEFAKGRAVRADRRAG